MSGRSFSWRVLGDLCAVKAGVLNRRVSPSALFRIGFVSRLRPRTGEGYGGTRPWKLLVFLPRGERGALTLGVRTRRSAGVSSPHTGATLWKNYQLSPRMHKVVRL